MHDKNDIRAGVLVWLWCWNLCDITARTTTAPAAEILLIELFTGEFAEGFESIPPGEIVGREPHLAGPLCILDGLATLTATHSTDTRSVTSSSEDNDASE